MDTRTAGLIIVVAGAIVIGIGLLVMTGALTRFGRLPGDIRIERDGVRVYAPIVSMLLVSIVLSVLLWLGRRFM